MESQDVGVRIAIDASELSLDDARDLFRDFVRFTPNVSPTRDGRETRTGNHLGLVTLPAVFSVVIAAGTYAGQKAVDVVFDFLKDWLRKKLSCEHRTITLYGPNGEVVKVIECDVKPHEQGRAESNVGLAKQ